jgi:ADP-L-glycero-D-manno-heptose 6-epimerase
LARLNKRADIEFIEMPDAVRERYQYFTQADTKKIRSAGLQFEFASLETGIEDYLESYLLRDDRFR